LTMVVWGVGGTIMGYTQGTTTCVVKYVPDMLDLKVFSNTPSAKLTRGMPRVFLGFLGFFFFVLGALHPIETGCISETMQQN
jgi:hypothetical protein